MLDLDRIGLVGPAETADQTPKMGVDRETRDIESVAQHDVCGLPPDPVQGDQVLEPTRHLSVETFDEIRRETQHRLGLGPEEARGREHRLHLSTVSTRECLGIGPAGEERGRDPIDRHVRGLGGQDRRDEQLQRVGEVQFAVGVRVASAQGPLHPTRSPRQRDR